MEIRTPPSGRISGPDSLPFDLLDFLGIRISIRGSTPPRRGHATGVNIDKKAQLQAIARGIVRLAGFPEPKRRPANASVIFQHCKPNRPQATIACL